MAILKPSPGAPMRRDAGMRQESKREPRQRMRSDHFDALGDVEAGRSGLDHEGGDAAGAGRFAGTGEDHVEIGNAAVGDESLLAIEHVVAALGPRRGRHGGDVGAGLGLGQREGGDGGALGDARQIAALELVRYRRARSARCRGPAW